MRAFTGHLPGTRAYRRLLAGLFFAGVATFAQLYVTQAVLPFVSDEFDVAPATAALTVSATTLGLAAAVIGWSVVADRIGRVRAMGIGIIAATALGLFAPFAPTFEILLGTRLLEGVALGAVPAIALAYLAEEIDAGHTASAAGSYIAGTTIGGLLGRLIAGPFGDLGQWRGGLFAVAAVCAVSATLFLRLVPPPRGFSTAPMRGLGRRLAANLRDPRQRVLYAQGLLLMGGFVAVYNYLGFRLAGEPFGLPLWIVSLLFLAYLSGTLVSPWAGRLASRHGRLPVLLASLGLTAGGILLTLVESLLPVIVGLLLFTAGFFAAHVVISGWAPAIARPDGRAQAASLYYLAYYGGSSLFGWALGVPFAAMGWTGMALGVLVMIVLAAGLAVPLRAGAGRATSLRGGRRRATVEP